MCVTRQRYRAAMSREKRHVRTARPHRIRVWDLPTRLFHWGLFATVATSLATGYLAPARWLTVHAWAGYTIAALLFFRAVWAFHGSEYSRLDRFIYGPARTWRHVRGLFARHGESSSIGHNPAGALMIFTLAAGLAGLLISGLIQLGGVEKQGPLATVASYATGADAGELHEGLAALLMALIVAHVAGVVWESLRSRENLASAMITGDKPIAASAPRPAQRPANIRRASAWLAVLAVMGTSAIWAAARVPPRGLTVTAPHPAFETECADCHQLYHPSLLTGAEWQALMATLSDHFGEDASLSPATTQSITNHLIRHGADRWDTKAAHLFRDPPPGHPGEISATPGWRRIHRALTDADFAQPKVKSRGNCRACHADAATGRFADQNIQPPKGKKP